MEEINRATKDDVDTLMALHELVNISINQRKVPPIKVFMMLLALAAYVFRHGYKEPTTEKFKRMLLEFHERAYNTIRDKRN